MYLTLGRHRITLSCLVMRWTLRCVKGPTQVMKVQLITMRIIFSDHSRSCKFLMHNGHDLLDLVDAREKAKKVGSSDVRVISWLRL